MSKKIRVCNPHDTAREHIHLGPHYTTSYGQSHTWIPPYGQNFVTVDKKPKRQVDPSLVSSIKCLDIERYKSDYVRNFPIRACSTNPNHMTKPPLCDTINYVTAFEQKLFRDPPPPMLPFQSEMKESYTTKSPALNERMVFPPNPYRVCKMKAFGRDEQPPLETEKPGIMKHLDIYLTTSRADYIPYDVIKQRGIACKDIVTYYDASGIPRGGKGYGPKKDTKIEPLIKTEIPTYDKKWKKVNNPYQTIPHRGFISEYKELYQHHTKSAMEAFGDLSAVATIPTIPNSSPWQNLCPPGMYCTDYCHIGTGYPINSIIETQKPVKQFKHTIGCKC